MTETVYWLALSRLPGIGRVTVQKAIGRLGSVAAIFAASDAQLLAIPRITPAVVHHLRRTSLAALTAELAQLTAAGIHVLPETAAAFPARLRSVRDRPLLLYARGKLPALNEAAVAIVGTRRPSPPAEQVAQQLGQALAAAGLTVVSGLAVGVDTAAHEGALQAGHTAAVLGCGLHQIYPPQNQLLAQRIAAAGVVLSELPPLTTVSATQLAARNRIISGLTTAVIVVESPVKGGAMITAQKAQRQQRWLLAVPGSPGTDALIAQGATALMPDAIDFDQFSQQIRQFQAAPASQLRLL